MLELPFPSYRIRLQNQRQTKSKPKFLRTYLRNLIEIESLKSIVGERSTHFVAEQFKLSGEDLQINLKLTGRLAPLR